MRFANRVCIVTGGASGIGRVTCRQLASEGGKVAVVDIDSKHGHETSDGLKAAGYDAAYFPADVSNSHDVQTAIAGVIEKWGRIDVLVNCAATMSFESVAELPDETWDQVLSTNLRSVFLFCKYSLPHMVGGAIVNVSSVHASRTTANVAPYAASKGGMEAFTRSLSQECRAQEIRVTCVAPGAVDTPMLWANPLVQSGEEKIEGAIGQPEDIASAIAFLASDGAGFITGAVLVVDGGRLTML